MPRRSRRTIIFSTNMAEKFIESRLSWRTAADAIITKISMIEHSWIQITNGTSRQKSYLDNRRRDLEFQVGDKVFLKVSPWKGVIRFGKKGKLSPRYIGPFDILDRFGDVSYRVALPPSLAYVHNVFHVSMLRKYVHSPTHVIDFEPLHVREDMTYDEQPVEILDFKEKVLRNKTVQLVKVLWRNHAVEEATWERESEMREMYPHLF
ncbi:hypothetical protein Dimus_038966 [Dionaea muscipula]